jgi:hypothetical protein
MGQEKTMKLADWIGKQITVVTTFGDESPQTVKLAEVEDSGIWITVEPVESVRHGGIYEEDLNKQFRKATKDRQSCAFVPFSSLRFLTVVLQPPQQPRVS